MLLILQLLRLKLLPPHLRFKYLITVVVQMQFKMKIVGKGHSERDELMLNARCHLHHVSGLSSNGCLGMILVQGRPRRPELEKMPLR